MLPPAAARVQQLEADNRQLTARIQYLEGFEAKARRLEEERSTFFAVLCNPSLQTTERIVALLTLFEAEHERAKGPDTGTHIPICAKAIAGRAGVSRDATGKAIDRLAKFGAWKKPPREQCRPMYDEENDRWTTPLVLELPGSLSQNLQTVARLAPSSDERKVLTGTGKPGSQPGEKREKIERTCPECGSSNTRLQCLDCGTITHTDEMVAPKSGDDEGGASASCGYPPRGTRSGHPDHRRGGVSASYGSYKR
ncbi:MAG: hypothetical protein NVS4B2_19590 [Chloroflexota bacterium]